MDAADVWVVSSRVDPDKGSHTAVVIGRGEEPLGKPADLRVALDQIYGRSAAH